MEIASGFTEEEGDKEKEEEDDDDEEEDDYMNRETAYERIFARSIGGAYYTLRHMES